jgi:hypothetical protein
VVLVAVGGPSGGIASIGGGDGVVPVVGPGASDVDGDGDASDGDGDASGRDGDAPGSGPAVAGTGVVAGDPGAAVAAVVESLGASVAPSVLGGGGGVEIGSVDADDTGSVVLVAGSIGAGSARTGSTDVGSASGGGAAVVTSAGRSLVAETTADPGSGAVVGSFAVWATAAGVRAPSPTANEAASARQKTPNGIVGISRPR